MTRTLCLTLTLTVQVAIAGELTVYPATVQLAGRNGMQQLIAVKTADGRAVADRTSSATFSTSNPKVFTVDKEGRVTPTGNGSATVTVTVGDRTATSSVTVSHFDQPHVPSFTNHVVPTLTRTGCNSGACHGALAGKGGFKLSLRGYDPSADHFAMTRQALGRRVDTTEPLVSLLLRKATRQMPHGGGSRFEVGSGHEELLRTWIASGAAGPSPDEPQLTRIEVYPPAALLDPADELRLIVTAKYADGRTADVTRLAKFVSTEEGVAGVDEDGRVTVNSSGESTVAVLFGTQVATATVTVPYPDRSEPAAFERSPRLNVIDDHVLRKLRLLNLPPSAQCTDAEFVRRAHLDTCGVLPTPAEVTAYLTDKSADKRVKLIDSLLARPEYVDYWSHKWSDLLLISTRKLTQQSMLGFYHAVRSSVADNRPWDRFAREILTARGSTLSKGGGNYFVLHQDVADLAESTAVTFLGTSITCARCHNHPLEKWTQDQYWAFANLFSRIGVKNGERAGERLVLSLPSGDALHLRTGVPMPPAPLGGPALELDSAVDRREHFVTWLTDPANPFFAKAVVNRIWRNYMGRGLVEAEDDLRDTNPATNVELLDALTAEFVRAKFDTKHLMRLILNSAAYQRSSVPLPANAADDRFYSRYLVRRLPAEVLLDAYSDVTGVPTPFDTVAVGNSGGNAKSNLYPPGTRAVQLPDSLPVSQFLDSFGRAERVLTCACETTTDSSVPQALHLNNGQTLNDKLRDKRSVVSRWLGDKLSDAEMVDRLFTTALGRQPTEAEKRSFVSELANARADGPQAHREAIEDAVWAVLSGQEFLFNR